MPTIQTGSLNPGGSSPTTSPEQRHRGPLTSTISSVKEVSGHPKATVMSLSPELLKIIFEYAQLPLLNIRRRISEINPTSTEFEFLVGCLMAPMSFPYLHAGVCLYWKDVLLSVPTFWTNAVILVGFPTTSLKDAVPRVFELSRNHPIDVTIRVSSATPDVAHSLLQEEVQYVLEQLNPHLHRCRSLYISTDLVSSLSLPYRHLRGETTILKTLIMKSEESCIAEKRPEDPVVEHTPFPDLFRPYLENLLIDYANFRYACEHPESLLAHPNLTSLAITNYTQGERPECFSVAQAVRALHAMPSLRSLKLQNINFGLLTEDGFLELGINEIFLEDIDSVVLGDIFKFTHLPELRQLWFRRCWVEEDCLDIPSECSQLILQEIPADEVLAPVLRRWDGECLTSLECPAFNDSVLEALSRPSNPDLLEDEVNEGTEFCCQELSGLAIICRSGISIAGLKSMVEKRNRWIHYDNPEWRTLQAPGPVIVHLHVKEFQDEAIFSPEDVEWFGARVADFKWSLLESELDKVGELLPV